MKNIKRMFFVLTLVTLIATVGAVCAADDADSTIAIDTSVSDVTTVTDTASDQIAAEPVTVTSYDNINTKNKEIKKDDKTPKTTGEKRNVNVNNYDELIDAINNASNDTTISECIINLNEGVYTSDITQITPTGTLNENITITINGNNQTLTGQQKSFYNKCLMIFNDLNIQHNLVSANGTNFTFQNTNASRITSNIGNTALTINNSKVSSIEYKENSNINIINSNVPNEVSCRGDNSNITISKSNTGYIGSFNNANIDITDSTVDYISGNGNVNITVADSTVNRYIYTSNNYVNINVLNSTITSYIIATNYVNINAINSTINDYISTTSNANITVKNSNTKRISSNSLLSLDITNTTCNDYIQIGANSNLTINNSTITGSEIRLQGDNLNINIFNNSAIPGTSMNSYRHVNITINDTTITPNNQLLLHGNTLLGDGVAFIGSSVIITNDGNLTITKGVDFSNTQHPSITNSGTMILEDNLILPTDTTFTNNGELIINNSNVLYPCTNTYTGNNTLINITIDKEITNIGELTLANVTINNTILNAGKLIISDNTSFTDNSIIKNKGEIEINDTNRIAPYLVSYATSTNKTVTVNNIDELTTAMNDAVADFDISGENDNYIINLNEQTYDFTSSITYNDGLYTTNIIINGNNQTISSAKRTMTYRNLCNNTINQATIDHGITVGSSNGKQPAHLTLNQVTANKTITIYSSSYLILNNSTINEKIDNRGTLIISDDTIFTSTSTLNNRATIITNNTNILYPFNNTFDDGTLKNMVIDKDITINGNFTLQNVTIDKTITNNGRIILSDDVTFTENGQIIGLGEIVTNNINQILPYIQTINGNYTITDTTLNKTYNFIGNNTIENCNITSTDNKNFGILNINNSNITIEEESTWITNYDLLIITNSNTSGNIKNNRELYIDNLPEDYTYDNTYHIINNDTAPLYFDVNNENKLNDLVKEGDTLDFQGTIVGLTRIKNLIINKPVNIITSTNNGRIENFDSITYNNGASGSNITGLYTYNTQFFVRNAHNIVFDNISNVVIEAGIGAGLGQTSIRENSTNITIKNSWIYTRDNGGRSSFVLAWADNCTIVNSTVEADGRVGNLVYLTTYGVGVPDGIIANSNNQILNNIIIGPEEGSVICWGIVLSGENNTIANNRIYYHGPAIVNQWGSGISGEGMNDNETSLVTIDNNTQINNTHIQHKPTNEVIIDTTTFTPGETTTIQATIRFTMQILTDINKGKVTFKVNGKTLKDENGKVIYAKVVNGVATIENYLVPDDWAKEGTTIEAIYSGSTQCEKLTSEKTNITITTPEPTITITSITDDVQAGSTVTLKAKVAAGDKAITTGKIVFKVNGKTVKDANGKVIYAKVDANGEVSVDYNLGNLKAGTYTIEATFIAPNYDKITSNTTMTVVKA